MVDTGAILAALDSLKVAREVSRALRTAENSIDTAELKLRVADLVDALVDAKSHLSDVRDLLDSKEDEIVELRKALKIKAELVRHVDAYYAQASDGSPTSQPFCSGCWEIDHHLIHLHNVPLGAGVRSCPRCKTNYDVRSVPDFTRYD